MFIRLAIVVIIAVLLQSITLAAEATNAGFVDGLWYSHENIFTNDTVRIYVAIRNNTGNELSGTVIFYENNRVIARKAIAAADGRVIESWADWQPSYGEHTLRAELSRITLVAVAGASAETTAVTSALATDTIFVDNDTDADGVGNKIDTDDNNDGVSDQIEQSNGTDPLVNDNIVPTALEDNAAEVTNERTSEVKQDQTTSVGFEQFLGPSPIEAVLSAVTTTAQQVKTTVDNYAAVRTLERAITTNDPNLAVDSDGFGEILRFATPKNIPETPPGFIGDLINFVSVILTSLMTGTLLALSFLFSFAMLVQVLLMLSILYSVYYLARRYGRRP